MVGHEREAIEIYAWVVIGKFVPGFLDDFAEAIGKHLASCDPAEQRALFLDADRYEIDCWG